MTTPIVELHPYPSAWSVLARAITELQPVTACYHHSTRVLCPHVLGWQGGRAKVLSLQIDTLDETPSKTRGAGHGWRTMFVDEMELAAPCKGDWVTPHDYYGHANGIDLVEFSVPPQATKPLLSKRYCL